MAMWLHQVIVMASQQNDATKAYIEHTQCKPLRPWNGTNIKLTFIISKYLVSHRYGRDSVNTNLPPALNWQSPNILGGLSRALTLQQKDILC